LFNNKDPLLGLFLFESKQNIEKVEVILIECEKSKAFDFEAINEIFRNMHSLKSSAALMGYENISDASHAVEDLFFYIREKHPVLDFQKVGDIVFCAIDFIKNEITKIEANEPLSDTNKEIRTLIEEYLHELKSVSHSTTKVSETKTTNNNFPELDVSSDLSNASSHKGNNYTACIKFCDDYDMLSTAAFVLLIQLEEVFSITNTFPNNLDDYDEASLLIKKHGFIITFKSKMDIDEVEKYLNTNIVGLKELTISSTGTNISTLPDNQKTQSLAYRNESDSNSSIKWEIKPQTKPSFISVDVRKLDALMDIVGELVISESMVTRNPEVLRLNIKSFKKASAQLKKMTSYLQDVVMSIRMVPIASTFISMQRVVRDMSKKLKKDIDLIIEGEDTEVDKNIIESISDPLIHLIRNCIDHGIEDIETRKILNKPEHGKIILSAAHDGEYVYISVKDDGKGLDRETILKKAGENDLLKKDESQLTDSEIWSFILIPGFSTKETISEFSGRGVGMDVVVKNLEKIGGRLNIDSEMGKGTTFKIRIPLTLAIMDGMEFVVGKNHYNIPIKLVKEAFKLKEYKIINDPDGNEFIIVRDECYEIVRIHTVFNVETKITNLEEGILIIVENEVKTYGIFADRLIGEHEMVVKPLPHYMGKIDGISGCTILGDGSISLIIDVDGLNSINLTNRNSNEKVLEFSEL